ncbi:histamine N-methyltransferase-like [Antennarius striatus]|uniref:histamine N-methyltransferase-like n=1 Tax=Antennarius striatus TaxID=241820 RepID=UPI0035B01226
MASPLKSLLSDSCRYLKSFQMYLERCNEHRLMQDFINNQLPNILSRTVRGKSHLNVIGVGSGSGEIDLKMLSALHLKNPHITVDNEVVELNPQQLSDFRDLVSLTPGLDYIRFHWYEMTAEEFEEQWKEKKMTKKVDLIHMFQMLYYVRDAGATISFFQSLLNRNGKLLFTLLSENSGWAKLWQTHSYQVCNKEINQVSTNDIKGLLDSKGLSYQGFALPCQIDITECFTEGDENGELLLDFLTHVLHFSKSAPPELKTEVMELLRHPDCSMESDGKIMLKHDCELVVIDQHS